MFTKEHVLKGEVIAGVGGGGGAVGIFLAEEACVEDASMVLIADAEIEICPVGISLTDQIYHQGSEQVKFTAA